MAALSPVYATREDLVDYGVPAGVTVPAEPEATRLLKRASEQITRVLFGSVYRIDSAGVPSDPDIRQAVRDATCAQAVWRLGYGPDSGDQDQYDSVAIGSINLTGRRSTTSTPGSTGGIADEALTHLRIAGLLGTGASLYY